MTISGLAGQASALGEEVLRALRERARQSGPFVDPAALATVSAARFFPEWAEAVLGRPYPGVRHVARWEISLLAMALAAEPDRPVPAAELARRDEVRRRVQAYEREQVEAREREAVAAAAEHSAWRALRERLPVPVTVGHNWTLRHTDTYALGSDHIVVQAGLQVGRLRRAARETLCETPAMRKPVARNGTSRDPLRGVDRHDDGEDRVPTCKTCLKYANRIAAPQTKRGHVSPGP